MKETKHGISTLEPNDEIRQIGDILSAIRRRRKSRSLHLVFLAQAERHCAVKIIENRTRQTHLATVFAQSEYKPNEIPSAPLEIKVQENLLTSENIATATFNFLSEHFPEAANYNINFYETYRDYKSKKAINFQKPAA